MNIRIFIIRICTVLILITFSSTTLGANKTNYIDIKGANHHFSPSNVAHVKRYPMKQKKLRYPTNTRKVYKPQQQAKRFKYAYKLPIKRLNPLKTTIIKGYKQRRKGS